MAAEPEMFDLLNKSKRNKVSPAMSRLLFECPGKDGETLPWCIGVIGNRTYSVGKGSGELTALGVEFVRDQGLPRHVVDGKVVPVHESIIGGWYCILKTGRNIPALCEILDNYIDAGIYDSQIDWQKSTITTDKQTAYKTIEAIKNKKFLLDVRSLGDVSAALGNNAPWNGE